MIRVLLVDDHTAFRQPLAFMLAREPDISVVGQAGTLSAARRLLAGVDVALVDLDLPDGNGLELVREVRATNPHGMVLVLTASLDKRDAARAVEAGAAGVLHKSVEIEEITAAIRRLRAGEFLLSTREIVELVRQAGRQREQDRAATVALGRLTARERDVLQALADGLNDKEIAQRLYISTQTARNHVASILGKLGVESRLQAAVFALRHGAATLR